MKMKKATMDDLDTILAILRNGRDQLAERGVDQWQGDYPNVQHIKEDIEHGYAYLAQSNDDLTVGTLAIVDAPDHFYDDLDGQWLMETEDYVVIHRVAIHSDYAGKGYASKLFVHMLDYLEEHRPAIKSIRISTNEHNQAMQHVIAKNGFTKVGTLHGAFRPQELSYVYELLVPSANPHPQA
ncbi:GNAT family N-acetyltransferase [Limosilactobacillus pontis]|uniref:GNAT family N-acetyltransferase n=1 Tax=Limosilactobacillus pontis TaxID=35787 RepID=UPI002248054A|nr:GNAT family N-acetyltransferase [Limosilactobacillus pontis]MCX2186134.1 GNAT family N-acetyltransferase [Limosilactobacillus pontis]MCX2188745.1 GNAT family N-acetyltransferase [Limosilactobacillus pontis]